MNVKVTQLYWMRASVTNESFERDKQTKKNQETKPIKHSSLFGIFFLIRFLFLETCPRDKLFIGAFFHNR